MLPEVERRRKRASQGVLRLDAVPGCPPTSSGSAVVLMERANNMPKGDELPSDDSILGGTRHLNAMNRLNVNLIRTMEVAPEAHLQT